ncbi:MAG: hypothetical protein ASARMPRED_008904 [Alectoria sarmentosa]|nr:MAG: hypothetical protein ASARMPRED_008904 [Alectoria sarmentosa]
MSRESLVEWADGTTGKVTFSDYGSSSNTIPMNSAMQKFAAEIKAQKEAEMNTPENLEIAAEAERAERVQKKHNFHHGRAFPSHLMEGWELIGGNRTDEEIRVYTRTYDWKHRFWGVKPIGITMYDFWERHDPEVTRHHDAQQECPINPDEPLGPLIDEPTKDLLPSTETAKLRRRQKSPEIDPAHRVSKSATLSPQTDKNTRKSLVDKDLAPYKRSRGRPAAKANLKSVDNDTSTISKRPRGRPATKAQRTAISDDALSNSPKRPRGRPPGKGKSTEKPSKLKKTSTVKGSRITKSSQSERRLSAPSTHKMRTRRGGPAELLKLP